MDSGIKPGDATGPRRRRLSFALVLTPLLLGNVVMLALCMGGFYVLSATRAYVGGESQWSKARAQAIDELRAYAASADPARLHAFERAMQVPLGDHQARLAMDEPQLDWQRASEGFARGRNAPEDVPGMIRLYRWAGSSRLMAPAVQAWRQGDGLIAELQALAGVLQQTLNEDPVARPQRLAQTLAALDQLALKLLEQELSFSAELGKASRATLQVLSATVALTALLLTLSAYAMQRSGLKRQGRYEAALEAANHRWSLAAEVDGLGVFEWQKHSDRVYLDARACAVYGLPINPNSPDGLEVPRSRVRALVDSSHTPGLQAALDAAVSDSGTLRQRFRIRPESSPDGELRHVEVTGAMLRGQPGAGEQRMVGVIKDITQQLQQEQLALDKQAAERSAAARMEFLSRLSHELRTPLNAVLGFSELMLMESNGEALSDKQRHRIQLIADSGRHLLSLVNDVLDISSIDAGRFSISCQPTLLAPALQAALELAAPEQQAYGVTMELQPLPPGLAVHADALRLGQVLANLLSNACKYNRPQGLVRVQAERLAEQVHISVQDQGAGLTAAEQAQLFQPFKRLDSGAHRPGTGLGLSIARLLAQQMGGDIKVESQPGQGSRFSLILQASESSERK
ncbi:hypothetical protein J7U46_02190 [Pelomonas sp. V22]|uniref:sensor histidine kinase n=1 Tax=Pelomonas sp. V22 TaxID=2822139 RepID=UPI0024A80E01|nr:sensor histidine kinase [Pelomonas sp. V22]MDI4631850.1 hypothetical protein [Pelomonas sp. V22]